MICPKCGKPLQMNQSVCHYCGTKVSPNQNKGLR
ncbi:MAG: zinc-ribbon domain-containing protein, partial [Eubacterium sp.]|nr:zinc-ribbon domain-containing protein [Eubacterium sp.]